MIIVFSSKAIADDGIKHRASEKAEADDDEEEVKHVRGPRFQGYMGRDPI
jgi:hypothetical protein